MLDAGAHQEQATRHCAGGGLPRLQGEHSNAVSADARLQVLGPPLAAHAVRRRVGRTRPSLPPDQAARRLPCASSQPQPHQVGESRAARCWPRCQRAPQGEISRRTSCGRRGHGAWCSSSGSRGGARGSRDIFSPIISLGGVKEGSRIGEHANLFLPPPPPLPPPPRASDADATSPRRTVRLVGCVTPQNSWQRCLPLPLPPPLPLLLLLPPSNRIRVPEDGGQ